MTKLTTLEKLTCDVTAVYLAWFLCWPIPELAFVCLLGFAALFRRTLSYIKNWTGGDFN